MSTEESVLIKLRTQRGTWLFVSLAVALLGAFTAVIGVGVLVADGFGVAERLVLGVGGSVAGFVLAIGAYLSFGVARAVPELRVAPDGFVLSHPGLLGAPLVVARNDVQEVFVAPPSAVSAANAAVQPHSWLLPDFSTPIGSSSRQWNLLIVFRQEFALADLPRRGIVAVAFIADRFSSYSGPPRGGLINGFLAEAEDPSEARRAFGPWGVLVDQPSDGALVRIGPEEARRRLKRRSGFKSHGRH